MEFPSGDICASRIHRGVIAWLDKVINPQAIKVKSLFMYVKMMINFDKDKNLASINEKSRQKIWLILKKTLLLHRFSRKALKFGLWCNGSTTGFGSVCPGSNPGSPTE